ncbi:MAG: PAS domain S-box protein [Usitatibacter sp.]
MSKRLPAGTAEERRLRNCLSDLIAVMTLSLVWRGHGSAEIVEALLEGMVGMLRLDFAYAALDHAVGGAPSEMLKPASLAPHLEALSASLRRARGRSRVKRVRVDSPTTGRGVNVAFLPLGFADSVGTIAAGSDRTDFPTQIEELVLQVAANQAAIGLLEARRLEEEKFASRNLEARVAARTAELSEMNSQVWAAMEERQHTESERAQLAVLVQNSDDFIGIATLDGRALFVNVAGQELLGLAGDESVVGLEVIDFIAESDRNLVTATVMPAVLREGRWDGEVCFRNLATGIEFPMHAHVFTLRDPRTGKPTSIATVSRDITQRKRAEAERVAMRDALAEELEEMTHLHQLSRPSRSRSEAQLLEDVLEATMKLQGADMGNVRLYHAQSRSYDLVAHRGFAPEYAERFKNLGEDALPYSTHLARGERVVIVDTDHDGDPKSLREMARIGGFRAVQSTPLFSGRGELLGLVTTHFRKPHRPSEHELRFSDLYARQVSDLIERRRAALALARSEANLAEGERISHTASWSVNVPTGEIFWSTEHYRIFGLDPDTAKPTREFWSMLHEDSRESTTAKFDAAIRDGRTFTDEFRVVRPDGEVRCCRSTGHPVFDAEGEVAEFVGSLIDLTDAKLAEEALRKARDELEHVARVTTMGELTASIAHEVNQPLAAVVANANACLHWLDAAPANLGEARAATTRIIRDGSRASEVIKRIRVFLTRGRLASAPLDLGEVCAEVVGMVRFDANARGVALEMSPATPVPLVMGDRVQLQQVLLNLIMNAIEALPSWNGGSKQVLVGVEPLGTDEVRVSVRDTGPGLAPGQRERIFDMFYTTKPRGLGLGLAISRSIIENHGGRLWASPDEGPGGTFQFALPVAGAEPR